MHQVDHQCGAARFRLLDGPWATLIVRELLHGPRRNVPVGRERPGIGLRAPARRGPLSGGGCVGGAERERTFT